MLSSTFEFNFRVSFSLTRPARVELVKMCDRITENDSNSVTMRFNLRESDEAATFKAALELIDAVRCVIVALCDERAQSYPLVVTRLAVTARRSR